MSLKCFGVVVCALVGSASVNEFVSNDKELSKESERRKSVDEKGKGVAPV